MRVVTFIQVRLVFVLLLGSLLCSCVPAAFVGGSTFAAVVYDQRSAKMMLLDRELAYQVALRLRRHKTLQGTHVHAYAFNRSVLLVGEVATAEQHRLVMKVARAVPKIRLVYDQVVLADSISFKERMQDAWITAKAKATLLNHVGLRSIQVKVITEQRVVYLMGIVTRSQGKMTIQALRGLPGVRRVVSLFEYSLI